MTHENLKIIRTDRYLDGGTKKFIFSDDVVIYQDFRLKSKTMGSFFDDYPTRGIEIFPSEKYVNLILKK